MTTESGVWFGSPERVCENLERKFSISEMRAAPDLFAIAAHSPISVPRLVAQFRMEPLAEPELKKIGLTVSSYPTVMCTRSRYIVSLELRNGGSTDLKSSDPYPVHLAYHWLGIGGKYVVFDGERTRLVPDATRGSTCSYEMNVISPDTPGTYLLRVTLVQERIRWFDQPSISLYRDLQISCEERGRATGLLSNEV